MSLARLGADTQARLRQYAIESNVDALTEFLDALSTFGPAARSHLVPRAFLFELWYAVRIKVPAWFIRALLRAGAGLFTPNDYLTLYQTLRDEPDYQRIVRDTAAHEGITILDKFLSS